MTTAGRQQRGLVDEVREVGADHPGRRRGDRAEVDIGTERHRAGVHLQDLEPTLPVRRLHDDAPVEPAGPQQRLVEHVRAVRRRQHDHAAVGAEAVHLGEDLVERLLALVVAAEARAAAARAADGIELIDEDDRRLRGLRLGEQVAHARGADAHDHLDELARAGREEGHAGLPRHRAGEQRLAGAGWAREQHAARDLAPERPVLVRVPEEVDDFDELLLCLLDAGDVVERDALEALVALGAGAAERAQRATARRRPAHGEDDDAEDQQGRAEAEQDLREHSAARVRRLRVDLDVARLQEAEQRRVRGQRGLVRREAREALLLDRHLPSELAFDALVGDRDEADVVALHLVQELRRVGDVGARRLVRDRRGDPVVEDQQAREDGPQAPTAHGRSRGRGSTAVVARVHAPARRPVFLAPIPAGSWKRDFLSGALGMGSGAMRGSYGTMRIVPSRPTWAAFAPKSWRESCATRRALAADGSGCGSASASRRSEIQRPPANTPSPRSCTLRMALSESGPRCRSSCSRRSCRASTRSGARDSAPCRG